MDLNRRSKDSEELYRGLFENSKDAVTINTPEGKFIDFNQSFLDLLGYSRSELRGMNVAEVYADAADRDEFRKEIERNGFVKDFEVRLRRKDGTLRDCLVTSTARHDKKGHITGYQGVMRDITERRRMEEELRRSEGRFRTIFQSNPIPALITAIEGLVLDVNEAWVRMTGFSRREAIGHSKIELGMVPDPKQRDQIVKDLLEKKRLSNVEMTRRTKSGELRYISNTLELVDLEGQKCILSMQVDITERKKMEDELKKYSEHLEELVEQRTRDVRESEEKYHHLIDNLTDAVFTIDLKGNFAFCSQGSEKMTGYPVQQLLSMNMTDLVAPEHMAEIQQRLKARIKGEKSLPPLQFEIVRADGKRLPVEMSTTPIVEGGSLVAIQGIARDITERKEINRLREQASNPSGRCR